MKKIFYYLVLATITMMTSFVFTSCDKDNDKLQVTPMDLSLGSAKGETGSFRITSNTMWTITGQADWLSISAHSGVGDTEIYVETLSANKTEQDRSVTLIVQGEKLSQTVTVTQMAGAKRLYVSMSNPVILSDGFFLDGSMGFFIKEKLKELLQKAEKTEKEKNILNDTDKFLFNNIGDPLMKALVYQRIKGKV